MKLPAWLPLVGASLLFGCAAQSAESPAFLPRESASVGGPFRGVTPAPPKESRESASPDRFAERGGSFAPASIVGPGLVRFSDGEEAPVTEVLREAQGGELFVEWNATYWRAEILGSSSDQGVLIHYQGWGPEYDETVPWSRVKYMVREPVR